MKYILWLDDLRNPAHVDYDHIIHAHTVVWAKDLDQAKACILLNGMPVQMFLDHDLGPYEDTMMFLKWLQEYDCVFKEFPEWSFLTANPVGMENMQAFLSSWKKSVEL